LNKDRSTLANALRLLKLPEKVRALVVSGQLSEGHRTTFRPEDGCTWLASLPMTEGSGQRPPDAGRGR